MTSMDRSRLLRGVAAVLAVVRRADGYGYDVVRRLCAAGLEIPHEERADLLEEVEASLVDAGDDPVAHLGTPARFAAELRASGGLPPRPVQPVAPRAPLWTRLKRHPHTRAAAATAREIAPIWWLLRGVIVAALLTVRVGRHYREIVAVLTGEPAIDAFLLAVIPNAVPGRLDPRPLR